MSMFSYWGSLLDGKKKWSVTWRIKLILWFRSWVTSKREQFMISMVKKDWKTCHHQEAADHHLEMALVGQMDSILGMQRISLQSSLEVVLLDLGHQDLVGLQDSTLMEGCLEDLVQPTIFFELALRGLCPGNLPQLRANCLAPLRSCTLDQQGRWRSLELLSMQLGMNIHLGAMLVLFNSFLFLNLLPWAIAFWIWLCKCLQFNLEIPYAIINASQVLSNLVHYPVLHFLDWILFQ